MILKLQGLPCLLTIEKMTLSYFNSEKTRVALVPPNPKELEILLEIGISVALLAE